MAAILSDLQQVMHCSYSLCEVHSSCCQYEPLHNRKSIGVPSITLPGCTQA